MAGSSSKQAAHEFFTISQQYGTKYYLTASGRDVTLAEKPEKADFPDTQLWFKEEAFFLFSKSKPEYALVKQPDNRPPSTRASVLATSRSADSQIEQLRSPAMDGGLRTASDDLGGGFIYIQESDLGKGLIYIASDAKLVFGEVPARTVELRPKPTGSDPNHEPTSRWKIEPLERKAQAATGASGSGSPTDNKRTGEDTAGGDPKKTDCTAAQAAISASGPGSPTDNKRTGEDTASGDPKKTDCTAAQAAIGASGPGSPTDNKRTGEDTAGGDPKKTDCTAGTKTPPTAGSSSKQADHKYYTISPQQSSAGTKYLTASSTSRDVTLDLEIKNAEKDKKPNFPENQLWSKKEVFFLFSKTKPKCALVEQKKDENQKKDEKQKKDDNRPIELRQTPAMDGLWTESERHPVDGWIYIQKASEPVLVFDAKFSLENGPPNVVLQEKRKPGSNPKETSRWKMERWKPEGQAAKAASVSRSPQTGIIGTGKGPASGGTSEKQPGCPAAAAASVVP